MIVQLEYVSIWWYITISMASVTITVKITRKHFLPNGLKCSFYLIAYHSFSLCGVLPPERSLIENWLSHDRRAMFWKAWTESTRDTVEDLECKLHATTNKVIGNAGGKVSTNPSWLSVKRHSLQQCNLLRFTFNDDRKDSIIWLWPRWPDAIISKAILQPLRFIESMLVVLCHCDGLWLWLRVLISDLLKAQFMANGSNCVLPFLFLSLALSLIQLKENPKFFNEKSLITFRNAVIHHS